MATALDFEHANFLWLSVGKWYYWVTWHSLNATVLHTVGDQISEISWIIIMGYCKDVILITGEVIK